MDTGMGLGDIDLTDLDAFVPGVPHDWFTRLRAEEPSKHVDPLGGPDFWVFTRHADVVAINKDNSTFSSARRSALMFEMPDDQLERQRLMMLNMDPPMHTRYRLLVNKGFTPRRVAELEQAIRRQTCAILDEALARGTFDFVTDVAAELPLQVIADLMGVPQSDRHLVFDWSNRMIGGQDEEYGTSAESSMIASMELFAYAHRLADEKRVDPHADLLSALTTVEVDGERLSELELDLFFLLLAVAGNETTRNLIAHGMLALLQHPDQYRALAADPTLLAGAVEEMLRHASPVMHFRRQATRDCQVNGHRVAEGDKVTIWYIAANRDERVFDHPQAFDVRRRPNPHVAFGGGGPHFCLGANLARLEIRVMFEEVLARGELTAAGPASRLRSNFINGIKHLPVSV